MIKVLGASPFVGRHMVSAHDAWLRHKLRKGWRLRTSRAKRLFDSQQPSLSGVQRRVIAELSECGLSKVPFSELFTRPGLWDRILDDANGWIEGDEVKTRGRLYAEESRGGSDSKDYMIRRYPKGATIPAESALLEVGLAPEVLDIANSYFGMLTRLYHADMWITFPLADTARPTGSRRWHRDPEDMKLLKVFLYLSDVDENSGPLHYIRNSRAGEKYGHLWPQRTPYGSLPEVDALEAQVRRSDWEVCTCTRGTLVFVDTTGFHMGGNVSSGERALATWAYVSEFSPWQRMFAIERLPRPIERLTNSEKFALYRAV